MNRVRSPIDHICPLSVTRAVDDDVDVSSATRSATISPPVGSIAMSPWTPPRMRHSTPSPGRRRRAAVPQCTPIGSIEHQRIPALLISSRRTESRFVLPMPLPP
jgi:hypothetical protein